MGSKAPVLRPVLPEQVPWLPGQPAGDRLAAAAAPRQLPINRSGTPVPVALDPRACAGGDWSSASSPARRRRVSTPCDTRVTCLRERAGDEVEDCVLDDVGVHETSGRRDYVVDLKPPCQVPALQEDRIGSPKTLDHESCSPSAAPTLSSLATVHSVGDAGRIIGGRTPAGLAGRHPCLGRVRMA